MLGQFDGNNGEGWKAVLGDKIDPRVKVGGVAGVWVDRGEATDGVTV